MPMIEGVLCDAGIGWSDIGMVGVTVGPGTFTGLRIGLAAARGIALAASVPVVGVTVMDAIAYATPAQERPGRTLLAIADGKRADLFIQGFDECLHPLGKAAAIMPEDINRIFPGPLLLAGDGAMRAADDARQGILSVVTGVDAVPLAFLAKRRYREGKGEALHPLYLAPPDVSIPKKI